ncbi:patatin family protein [Vibrio cholerae]
MKALVVEGGAMRGIFAAGVLDTFIHQDYYPYDFTLGVSAGSTNLIGYLSKQPERSFNVITQLATDRRFYDPRRFLKGGNLVDVGWLIRESNRRYPINETMMFGNMPLIAAATNIDTGEADYYQVKPHNLEQVIEATCALPIAYKHTPCFSGNCYTDGGVSDSIPVAEAHRRGAREITVILSHPLSYRMPKAKHPWLMRRLLTKYPAIANAMAVRAENYNRSLDFIRNPPKGTQVRVIAPDETFQVNRLTMRQDRLLDGYKMGLREGNKHLASRAGTYGLTRENCHFCL